VPGQADDFDSTVFKKGTDVLMAIGLRLQTHVVPLFQFNESGRPELVGSSLYYAEGPFRFLLTAGHVILEKFPAKLWYPHSLESLAELPIQGFSYAKETDLDLLVAQLDRDLPLYRPITVLGVGAFASSEPFQHMLIGYPASQAKATTDQTNVKVQAYITGAAPTGEYKRLSVNPENQGIVEFKKERVYNESGQMMTFPDPNGMSGGGVFQYHESFPGRATLVGVMTRWDTERKKAIVFTKIEQIRKIFSLKEVKA
jgi:hypothetical protein